VRSEGKSGHPAEEGIRKNDQTERSVNAPGGIAQLGKVERPRLILLLLKGIEKSKGLVRRPQWGLTTPPYNERVKDRKKGRPGLPARATRGLRRWEGSGQVPFLFAECAVKMRSLDTRSESAPGSSLIEEGRRNLVGEKAMN